MQQLQVTTVTVLIMTISMIAKDEVIVDITTDITTAHDKLKYTESL